MKSVPVVGLNASAVGRLRSFVKTAVSRVREEGTVPEIPNTIPPELIPTK